jgi:hypothetical protein
MRSALTLIFELCLCGIGYATSRKCGGHEYSARELQHLVDAEVRRRGGSPGPARHSRIEVLRSACDYLYRETYLPEMPGAFLYARIDRNGRCWTCYQGCDVTTRGPTTCARVHPTPRRPPRHPAGRGAGRGPSPMPSRLSPTRALYPRPGAPFSPDEPAPCLLFPFRDHWLHSLTGRGPQRSREPLAVCRSQKESCSHASTCSEDGVGWSPRRPGGSSGCRRRRRPAETGGLADRHRAERPAWRLVGGDPGAHAGPAGDPTGPRHLRRSERMPGRPRPRQVSGTRRPARSARRSGRPAPLLCRD